MDENGDTSETGLDGWYTLLGNMRRMRIGGKKSGGCLKHRQRADTYCLFPLLDGGSFTILFHWRDRAKHVKHIPTDNTQSLLSVGLCACNTLCSSYVRGLCTF